MIQFWMLNTLTRPSKNPQAAVVCRQGASMRSPRSWWVTRPVLFAVLFAVLVGQLRYTTNQVDCYFMATKIENVPIFTVYFFWLHVPRFCLLGRKKDFKSDDFLFFLNTSLEQKTSWNVPTVTYSNLEFFFLHVMTRVVSGIPGRKVSFGSMLFYESDLLGAQPEWTWQYKIHASSRLSCKSVKRVPSVFVGKIITDRHRFGLHEDDHFQYPPKV